jgi:hypothetical protein
LTVGKFERGLTMNKQDARKCFFAVVFVLSTALGSAAAFATMSGIDHLADYLSVSDFSVDGTGGFQAGTGAGSGPSPSLPEEWYPGLTVDVKWTVSDWKHGGGERHEANVPVEPYTEVGDVYVHFLADGAVRVVVSNDYPWNSNYPGPHDPIPNKHPWKDYPPPTRKGPVFSPDEVKKYHPDLQEFKHG